MTMRELTLDVPRELPFLEAISWFDKEWRRLEPIDMLRRYESSWRHHGVLAEPSNEEEAFIRSLVEAYGSHLDV